MLIDLDPNPPRPVPLRQRLHRTVRDIHHRLTGLPRRAHASLLGLSWHMQITLIVDATLDTADPDLAETVVRRFLTEPATRVEVSDLWDRHHIGAAPITTIASITVHHINEEYDTCEVTATITTNLAVNARDAHCPYAIAELTPWISTYATTRWERIVRLDSYASTTTSVPIRHA
jgi:hypothetical protein